MVPDRADAIIQRGYQFGQNRIQCGVHWQSDVDAGRLVGAAVVAQLHANADFNAQLAEARKAHRRALRDCVRRHQPGLHALVQAISTRVSA